MATWKNLDTLASYSKLAGLKGHVNIAEAMTGENGAERVKKYSAPMAAGLAYNYAGQCASANDSALCTSDGIYAPHE